MTAESPYKTSDFYIIRVSIDPGGEGERPTEGVIMYKSIMVSNHEKTGSVIRSAMMKHGLEGSPDHYTLSQVLPDKGIYDLDTACFPPPSFKDTHTHKKDTILHNQEVLPISRNASTHLHRTPI